jgi:hypothetical protein
VARQFKGARHGLDDKLAAELIEFCELTDAIPSKVIIRAVRDYLVTQRSDPSFQQRLQAMRNRSSNKR